MRKLEDIYVALWCIGMPITGTILLPIQGTIPAYVMAFGSLILVFMKVRSGEIPESVVRYLKTFLSLFLLWLLLLVASQLGLMASDRHDFGGAPLVDMNDESILFRRTIFTQSLYFFACVLIGLFFRYCFKPRWRRYVHWGGYFLAAYGIYEWVYYLVFHEPGDFLVNRTFGEHTASWSQAISFGSINLLRIKSTLGEPTFFAAVVLPYLFLALDDRKKILSGMLLFAAIFSTSTALLITLPFVLFLMSFWSRKIRWGILFILAAFGLLMVAVALTFPDTFRNTFIDKISGENQSGAMRMENALGLQQLYESFSIPNWLFGIGFGNAYLGIFDGLVVNTGFIGLAVFLWVFIRPTWSLPATPGYEGLKAGLLSILILCRLSLSELFLPTTWMFVGLSWYYLAEYQRSRVQLPAMISWPQTPGPVSEPKKETALEATPRQPLPPRTG